MRGRIAFFIVLAIVVATVLLGLHTGAQVPPPVDLLIIRGRVYTADPARPFAQAIGVRGNMIAFVGSNGDGERLRGPRTLVIEAGGKSVTPGFTDSHIHLVGGGLDLSNVNLLDETTLEGILARIKAFAEAHRERGWIQGRGWYYAPFPGGLPLREQLDKAVPDRPAYMVCYDGHTGWANSRALKLAGITKKTPNPVNGLIVKDPKTGEPTGVLKEAAQGLVRKVLPKPTRPDEIAGIKAAEREAARFGLTSIQNAHGTPEDFQRYEAVRQSGDLTLRVYTALSLHPEFKEEEWAAFDAVRKKFPDDPLLKAGAVKGVVDGVIEAHTAAMLEPYTNRPTSGAPNYTPDDLTRIVTEADRRGYQVFLHAIGDRGVRMALDAYEQAARANHTTGRRHRVEHIETIDASDIPRFGALGVIASMQPFHADPSPNQVSVWAGNIGPERALRAWAWRAVKEAGGRISFGSDWPVVSLDPIIGLNMAINRTNKDGKPEGGWLPEQRLSVADAIDAYTIGAAYASFDEKRKGSIEVGKLADLVVWSQDMFGIPRDQILKTRVVVTVFDGKVIYRADARRTTSQ